MIQVANSNAAFTDDNRISFATTLLKGTDAFWWYTLLISNGTPSKWERFVAPIVREFIPQDHERRARDSLQGCKQSGSVAEYQNIQFEVRKANRTEFEEATNIARRVEAAFANILFNQGHGIPQTHVGGSTGNSVSDPMAIDHTELHRSARSEQRLMDIKKGLL